MPAPPPPPLPDPTLSLLVPADAAACLALDRAALGGLWSLEQWRRELEEEGRPGLGLRRGADLLAMASGWLVVDELHITLVAVAPDQRRRGLGRRVLQALMAAGRERGARHATLEVAAGNGPGIALYEALGFRTAGIRHGYYRNGEDALIQWVNLTLGT
ncbi:GNAT family N-acetyltransferase [Aphanothece minutissima]|uniref:Ribosomal-protein-alanine acetyltransferase n=1 Tax=Aphanothece cf. minutissima CCALA 015 TaxID=2107695 RepID=A0ABX5F6J6_9CHRO|nr:GNAT family N-acetyltransferase [Aphanothece minutissima]PSB37186.1 ribosomal-protein-alanine acetyltransferase [Aphanothece cf. minutissima CCALA 015]